MEIQIIYGNSFTALLKSRSVSFVVHTRSVSGTFATYSHDFQVAQLSLRENGWRMYSLFNLLSFDVVQMKHWERLPHYLSVIFVTVLSLWRINLEGDLCQQCHPLNPEGVRCYRDWWCRIKEGQQWRVSNGRPPSFPVNCRKETHGIFRQGWVTSICEINYRKGVSVVYYQQKIR